MLDKTKASVLDQATLDIFKAAMARFTMIRDAQRDTERDVRIVKPALIGKQIVTPQGKRYEITEVTNGYDGTIKARGYIIKANGKRGSQTWDIGFICPAYFDEAAQ